MLRKSLTTLTLILFTSIISGCGQVVIKNTEWCVDRGDMGAVCFNTLNDNTRTMDKPTWDEYRFGNVCGTPQAFAELKKEIEQFCNQTNKCSYEQQQRIARVGKIIRQMQNH